MRKILTAAVLFFAIGITGCGGDSGSPKDYSIAQSGEWKDGSYTETAKGKRGDFEVTVVISGGKINNINVGNNQETTDKGGNAIDKISSEVISAQTWDVDAVTGATITSEAFKDAIARCLEQASE